MVLPTLLRTANPNPHYLPLFFMLIFLSSSIKIRDCKRSLPRFEVMNTQDFGEVNSRKTEDLSGLRQSPLLSDTAVSSMHLARGTQLSALSYFSLVCSSPWRETFSSVQSLSCVHSLQPHGLQHARPPCPSRTPRAYSNSCPSISDAIQPSHPLSSPSPPAFNFSSISVFSVSQCFTSGGWSIGASASLFPMNILGWFPLELTGLICSQSKGLSRVFSNTTVQKHQFFGAQLYLWSNSHNHTWLLKKTIALTRRTFVGKVMSLLFNVLSRLVIAFLWSILISWLQSPYAVILEPKKIKSVTVSSFHCFSIYLPWSDGTRHHDLSFLNAEF